MSKFFKNYIFYEFLKFSYFYVKKLKLKKNSKQKVYTFSVMLEVYTLENNKRIIHRKFQVIIFIGSLDIMHGVNRYLKKALTFCTKKRVEKKHKKYIFFCKIRSEGIIKCPNTLCILIWLICVSICMRKCCFLVIFY